MMNYRRIVLACSLLAVLFAGCKKESESDSDAISLNVSQDAVSCDSKFGISMWYAATPYLLYNFNNGDSAYINGQAYEAKFPRHNVLGGGSDTALTATFYIPKGAVSAAGELKMLFPTIAFTNLGGGQPALPACRMPDSCNALRNRGITKFHRGDFIPPTVGVATFSVARGADVDIVLRNTVAVHCIGFQTCEGFDNETYNSAHGTLHVHRVHLTSLNGEPLCGNAVVDSAYTETPTLRFLDRSAAGFQELDLTVNDTTVKGRNLIFGFFTAPMPACSLRVEIFYEVVHPDAGHDRDRYQKLTYTMTSDGRPLLRNYYYPTDLLPQGTASFLANHWSIVTASEMD